MKIFIASLLLLWLTCVIVGQATSSVVETVVVYSENGDFYLRSTPYDNEYPSTRGVTVVYRKGIALPIYTFERGFDSIDDDSNNLVLSNDGRVIFYVIPWGADETRDDLKSITIYKQGKLTKSFTENEITGCDKSKERCDLLYSNYDRVVDKSKSGWGTGSYKKVYKDGTNEKEKFLSDFPLFTFTDVVYLTDSKRTLHKFDLNMVSHPESLPFDRAFDNIKTKGRHNKVELKRHDITPYSDFPKLQDGRNTADALATLLGMKTATIVGTKDDAFRVYQFKINALISQDGKVEIENLEISDDLPREKIKQFFTTNRFDLKGTPPIFPKRYYEDYFYFRNKIDAQARKEKRAQQTRDREELKKRLIAESIEGRYIPKDLAEAFQQLDKELPEIDRNEMTALASRKEMIKYHMGLGMWMRNNWGLWGGSRLQKYFTDKGIGHPDDMSSVVLFCYWDWLQGKKENWREWEKDPKQKIF